MKEILIKGIIAFMIVVFFLTIMKDIYSNYDEISIVIGMFTLFIVDLIMD